MSGDQQCAVLSLCGIERQLCRRCFGTLCEKPPPPPAHLAPPDTWPSTSSHANLAPLQLPAVFTCDLGLIVLRFLALFAPSKICNMQTWPPEGGPTQSSPTPSAWLGSVCAYMHSCMFGLACWVGEDGFLLLLKKKQKFCGGSDFLC